MGRSIQFVLILSGLIFFVALIFAYPQSCYANRFYKGVYQQSNLYNYNTPYDYNSTITYTSRWHRGRKIPITIIRNNNYGYRSNLYGYAGNNYDCDNNNNSYRQSIYSIKYKNRKHKRNHHKHKQRLNNPSNFFSY